jgi:hypothetical protein
MKKGLFTLFLLITTALPALAAPGNTSGPWGVDAGGFRNLSTALAAPGYSGKTFVISKPMAINNKTLPTTRHIKFIGGGFINPAAGKVFDFAGQNPKAGLYQIFGGSGSITGLTKASPEWWPGMNLGPAVAAMPNGGVVKLQIATYISPFMSDATTMGTNNIHFAGSKMPSVNAGSTALEKGTIIQGVFSIEAHNASVSDLGVDVGSDYCTAVGATAGLEGLDVTGLGTFPSPTNPWKGFRAENIQVLGQSPTTVAHAFLIDYVDGAFIKNIHTKYNEHGIVFKALNTTASGLWATDHYADGLIIRSSYYANESNSNYSGINITATVQGGGGGLRISAEDAYMNNENISDVYVNNTTYGFWTTGTAPWGNSGMNLTNANVTNIGSGGYGPGVGYQIDPTTDHLTMNNVTAQHGLSTGFVVARGATNIKINNANSLTNAGYGYAVDSLSTKITNSNSNSNTAGGLYVTTAVSVDGSTFSDGITVSGGGKIINPNVPFTPVHPTLLNSWVYFGNGPDVFWWQDYGRVRLMGLIKSGTLSTTIFTLPVGFRPATNKRFPVSCWNGTTGVYGELLIASTGDVSLQYGANGYLSLDGVEFSMAND